MTTTPDTRHTERHTPGVNGQLPARHLDFYESMSHFKHMFPDMEEDVIEAVLRANNGAVDATIDQLLTMSVDNEEQDLRNTPLLTEENDKDTSQWDPPNYDTAMQNSDPSTRNSKEKSNPVPLGYSPPSSENAGVWLEPLEPHADYAPRLSHSRRERFAKQSPSKNNKSLSSTDSFSNKLSVHSYGRSQSTSKGSTQIKQYKHWNPPMLGTLPDDFLRITETSPSPGRPSRSGGAVSRTPSVPVTSRDASDSEEHHRRHRSRTSLHHRNSSGQMSCEMLQQKILENEMKRCSITADVDPEQAQFLEDERTALMMQNQEFLEMLRRNEDFMKTLERDRMNAAAFDPQPASPIPPVLSDTIRPDQIEGYGQDRQDKLDTFPFGKELPKDEDAEFRKQLSQMGGSSKKKFQALARKFFKSKKKKSPKQMLKENSAPSTANLLEEFDDEDDVEFRPDQQKGDSYLGAVRELPSSPYRQQISYQPDKNPANLDQRRSDML